MKRDPILFWGALASIVTMPCHYGLSTFLFGPRAGALTVADALVWLLFAYWLIYHLLPYLARRGPQPVALEVLRSSRLAGPIAAFLAVAVLAAFRTDNPPQTIKELIQFAEFFVVAPVVFLEALSQERGLNWAVGALAAATVGTVLIGLWQVFGPGAGPESLEEYEAAMRAWWFPIFGRTMLNLGDPLVVRGLFGSRTIYGGFLAMTLPFFWAMWVRRRGHLVGALLLTLLLGGMVSFVIGGPFWAFVAALAVVGALASTRPPVRVLTIAVAMEIAAFVLIVGPFGSENLTTLSLTEPVDGRPTLVKRYAEWGAAVTMIQDDANLVLGSGPGTYQSHIGRYYGFLPNPEKMEPDVQNQYLVLGCTLGLAGLFAFVFILFQAGRLCYEVRTKAPPETLIRDAALGTLGALVGFGLACIFGGLLVRGTGLALSLFLSFAAWINLRHQETQTP